MRCDEIQQFLLTDFLDDELSPGKKASVEGHLAGCAACREFLAAARKADEALASFGEGAVPAAHVWNTVSARIDEGDVPLTERIRAWWGCAVGGPRPVFVLASAMAVLLVMLVVPVGLQRQQAASLAEKEALVQLVFFDDNGSSVMGVEDVGRGTAVEYWL